MIKFSKRLSIMLGLTLSQAASAGISGGGGGPPPMMESIERDEFLMLSQDIINSRLRGETLTLKVKSRVLEPQTVDLLRQVINTQDTSTGEPVLLLPELAE